MKQGIYSYSKLSRTKILWIVKDAFENKEEYFIKNEINIEQEKDLVNEHAQNKISPLIRYSIWEKFRWKNIKTRSSQNKSISPRSS